MENTASIMTVVSKPPGTCEISNIIFKILISQFPIRLPQLHPFKSRYKQSDGSSLVSFCRMRD